MIDEAKATSRPSAVLFMTSPETIPAFNKRLSMTVPRLSSSSLAARADATLDTSTSRVSKGSRPTRSARACLAVSAFSKVRQAKMTRP
jgi:hypothetical protein